MSDANCDNCGQHISACVCQSENNKIELYLKPPFYNELVEERDSLLEQNKKLSAELAEALDQLFKEKSISQHALEAVKLAIGLIHCDSTCVAWSSSQCQCGTLDALAKLKERHKDL